MNIDDYETVRYMGKSSTTSIATTTPLFFGNSNTNVPTELADSTQQFRGCIGDVTVNGR